jgi:hypothetical protein
MMFLLGANVTSFAAQRKPPKPDAKQSAAIVEQLLKQSGQKYIKAGDGVWVIRRKGENLPYFQVVLSSVPGYVVAEVVVAGKKNMNLTIEGTLNLLHLTDKLGYPKVGLDGDGDLFVRNDVRLKSLDLEVLVAAIDAVAAAADRTYAEVKPFLIK